MQSQDLINLVQVPNIPPGSLCGSPEQYLLEYKNTRQPVSQEGSHSKSVLNNWYIVWHSISFVLLSVCVCFFSFSILNTTRAPWMVHCVSKIQGQLLLSKLGERTTEELAQQVWLEEKQQDRERQKKQEKTEGKTIKLIEGKANTECQMDHN